MKQQGHRRLAGAEPLQALTRIDGLHHRMMIHRHARPLALLHEEDDSRSLRKRGNRSRLNRLRRLGPLRFRRLRDPAQLDRVLDELIAHYDARQVLVHGTAPFRNDAAKRRYYRDLFAAAPDDVCVTVSYIAERPVAAFLGPRTGSMVHLGLLMHAPDLEAHSPGKLHLLQLREHLSAEGMTVLDLTPGGDAWKERFAQTHDEVFEVVLFRSRLSYQLATGWRALTALGKRLLRRSR